MQIKNCIWESIIRQQGGIDRPRLLNYASGITGIFLLLMFQSLRAEEADSAELLDIPLQRLLTLEVSSASTYSQKLHFAPSSAIIGASQDIRSYGYGAFAYALESFHGLYFTTDRGWGYLSRSKASLGSQSNSGKFDGKYANAIDLQETIWQIKCVFNIKLDYHFQSC